MENFENELNARFHVDRVHKAEVENGWKPVAMKSGPKLTGFYLSREAIMPESSPVDDNRANATIERSS